MTHHNIFSKFNPSSNTGTGKHIFDFLGVATNTAYKNGWGKHAVPSGSKFTTGYPPLNEHYFDWIALLTSVSNAKGTFRMAELGAGWAPWLVRASFAAQQISAIDKVELLAVEADPTHYNWIIDHFLDNNLNPNDYYILNGAVSNTSSTLKFPKLSNPNSNYGASLNAVTNETKFIEVQGYTLENLINKFSGALDFLHIDIQGAEYDVIPSSIKLLKNNVKTIMVGTHTSSNKHEELYSLFSQHGWEPILIFPRHEKVNTEFGVVQFDDGFQFWRNPTLV